MLSIFSPLVPCWIIISPLVSCWIFSLHWYHVEYFLHWYRVEYFLSTATMLNIFSPLVPCWIFFLHWYHVEYFLSTGTMWNIFSWYHVHVEYLFPTGIMLHVSRSAVCISSYRPRCPIIAVTRDDMSARQLRLQRGLLPLLYKGKRTHTLHLGLLVSNFYFFIFFILLFHQHSISQNIKTDKFKLGHNVDRNRHSFGDHAVCLSLPWVRPS